AREAVGGGGAAGAGSGRHRAPEPRASPGRPPLQQRPSQPPLRRRHAAAERSSGRHRQHRREPSKPGPVRAAVRPAGHGRGGHHRTGTLPANGVRLVRPAEGRWMMAGFRAVTGMEGELKDLYADDETKVAELRRAQQQDDEMATAAGRWRAAQRLFGGQPEGPAPRRSTATDRLQSETTLRKQLGEKREKDRDTDSLTTYLE